jgi:glycosyltransferase involved in cell wall biosynthesis
MDEVSIIVPCHNRLALLVPTLEALQNQTFTKFEVILVDDASTVDIVSHIKTILLDSRFKIVRLEENSGESNAVNMGWKNSKYRYRAIVNSDDPQHPKWLEGMADFVLNNPGYVFYYPDLITIDENSNEIRRQKLYEWSAPLMFGKMIAIASAGTIIDSSFFPEDFKPRDPDVKYPSDLIQIFKMSEFGNGKRAEGNWGIWRNHKDSLTNSQNVTEKVSRYERTLLSWIEENGSRIASEVEISKSLTYLYAQYWVMLRATFGLLRSLTNILSSNFISQIKKNPKMKIEIPRLISKLISKKIMSIFALIFPSNNRIH